jgi:hypothetical protein
MTPDTHPTKVIFRADKDGEITAIFPALAGTNDTWTCTCYAHLGQHSYASLDYIRATRPATPEQFAPLLAELR